MIGDPNAGALRAPGFVQFDFSLLRNFRIKERMALNFRGEFFNAFNHTNLACLGAPSEGRDSL